VILILALLSVTDFSGVWQTTYGRMVLNQEGSAVTGFYTYQGISGIQGTVNQAGRLVFTYTEPDAEGEGWFELGEGGISGLWRATGSSTWSSWEGYRVGDDQSGRWLVVFEAQWESFLDEPHYSFGSMLSEWFRRVPGVQVRHRWFHSAEDLRSLSIEAAMLQGDVYLVISAHATVDGVSCRGGMIPLATVVECIRSVEGNARLVHFSSCEILGGRLPGMLRGLSDSVFVSGYDRSVGWSASGIIEIYYLNLMLEFGLQPLRAAETVLASISFAGEKPGVHDEAAGFTWVGRAGRGR
jgi:hypothetical protein